ncbi:hypothetical protein BH23VER1_BH23VER1_23980 [soil metagenome]
MNTMNATTLKLALAAGAILPVFLDAASKGILLLLVSLAVVAGLRRAAASVRHLVWAASAAALLALPLLSLALPKWRVLPADWLMANDAVVPPEAVGGGEVVADTVSLPTGLALAEGTAEPVASASATWGGWEIAVAVWGAGVLVLLGRLGVGRWRLFRLGSRSRAAVDPIVSMAAEVAETLGVRRPVRVLMGSERCMPMTWGTFRPHILLPAGASAWAPDHLRAVLLHEFAHVRRCDTATQLVIRAACALHWFNPLAWVAVRCAEVERERACDDLVLAHGVRASDYAEDLMQVVVQNPLVAAPHSGLAMARPSTLEKRLAAILDARLNRRRLTRQKAILLGIAGLAVACPMAMLDAADRDRPTAEQEGEVPHPTSDEPARPPGTLSQLRSDLSRKTAAREQLLQIYTDDHPQLKALDAVIGRLERGIAELEAEQAAAESDLPPELRQLEPFDGDASSFAGIGVAMYKEKEPPYPIIHLILEGGSAEASGKLEKSDRILAIRQADSSRWIDLAHMHLEVVVQLIRGEPGTPVFLRLSRDGGEPFEVELERRDIALAETDPAAGTPQVTVTRTVAVQHADSEEVSATISALGIENVRVVPQVRTNSLVLRGTEAALAEVSAVIDQLDGGSHLQAAEDANRLLTRVFSVPPTYFETADGVRTTAKEILQNAGMTFPEGASAFYNKATSQLIVRNTAPNLERIPQYLSGGITKPKGGLLREATISLAGSGEYQTIEVDGVAVSPAELAEHVGLLDPRPEKVVVTADRATRYQRVLDVVDALKKAGISNVTFRVQPEPE